MTKNDKCEHGQSWMLACSACNAGVQLGLYPEPQAPSALGARATSRAAQQAYNLLHTGGLAAFDARYGATASTALNTWADEGRIKIRHTPTGMTVQTFKKYANNDLEVREHCGATAAHESHVWSDPAPRGGERWCSGAAASVGLGDVPQDRSADGVPETEQANTPAEARTGTSDRVAAALSELSALRSKLHPASAISTDLARIMQLLKAESGPVPQRATDRHGDLLWVHACGRADLGEGEIPPRYCRGCAYDEHTNWHPLYVLTDGA